ncbi:MAG: hypothetical protein WBV73_27260 [Phormidium sp.]
MIYNYQEEGYEVVDNSRYFPMMNISEILVECFRVAGDRNTSTAIRNLRQNLANQK